MTHQAMSGLLLYLLSLHSVGHALLAWDRGTLSRPWALALWAGLLAAARAGAEPLGVRFSALVDGRGARRIRIALAAFYAFVVMVFPLAVAFEPRLLGSEVRLFAPLQVAFLLVSAFEVGVAGAIANALTLVVLASLRGGMLSAGAVTGAFVWLGGFLVYDRFARTLAVYPRARIPPVSVPLRQAVGMVAPVALALGVLLTIAPPTPLVRVHAFATVAMPRQELTTAYGVLALLGFLGASALYGLTRLLRQARSGEPPLCEAVETTAAVEEPVSLPGRSRRVAYPGPRGRIVRAYVRFLRAAQRRVLRRHPSQTPAEIAALVAEPAVPLSALTDLFARARYGPDEPSETEACAAERAAATVIAALQRARQPSR